MTERREIRTGRQGRQRENSRGNNRDDKGGNTGQPMFPPYFF
jgi:hypothetical protein